MQHKLFWSFVGAMGVVVVVSNILVQFLLGDWLTWAAFTYPVAFLITDLANRLLGKEIAQKVVLYGFVTGVFCSLVASQLSTSEGVPYTTLRIALGSGLAFLVAQLTDVYVFHRLRKLAWWKTPFLSSLVGSLVDTVLFFTIAFSAIFVFLEPNNDVTWATELVPLLGFGTLLPLWVSLAAADFLVKMLIAGMALVPFRIVTQRVLGRGKTFDSSNGLASQQD